MLQRCNINQVIPLRRKRQQGLIPRKREQVSYGKKMTRTTFKGVMLPANGAVHTGSISADVNENREQGNGNKKLVDI